MGAGKNHEQVRHVGGRSTSGGDLKLTQHLGSLQDGKFYPSQNPTDEAWATVDLLGAVDFLSPLVAKLEEGGARDKAEAQASYASLRLRQASEFRAAAAGATLLTSPMLLYYSALNLTRAYLTIRGRERASRRPSHGLSYRGSKSILECGARLTKGGTFVDYCNPTDRTPDTLTLTECLTRIPEIAADLGAARIEMEPQIEPVTVTAEIAGAATLSLPRLARNPAGDERPLSTALEELRRIAPSTAAQCKPGHVPHCVTLPIGATPQECTRGHVSKKLNEVLLTELNYQMLGSTWYLLHPHASGSEALSRGSYYFAALFILSNLSRYEPEALASEASPPTRTGWLLTRFLRAAERHFPQVVLGQVFDEPVFFPSA